MSNDYTLKVDGYTYERTNGSHAIYKKIGYNNIIINRKLNPMIAKRLIKENNLIEKG